MPNREVILIGGSAGSGSAIRTIISSFPPDFRAVVFIAVHRAEMGGIDYLPVSLRRSTSLPVIPIENSQPFEMGHIYIAPRVGHLIIQNRAVEIDNTAAASSRNRIDSMFRSAAEAYASSVIGIILNGLLHDGVAGCWDIRKRGGITIAQDPNEARNTSMPQSAMERVSVDYCFRASEIGPKVVNTGCRLSVRAGFGRRSNHDRRR